MKAFLHSEASRELTDISEWYDVRETGLGLDFILEFETAVNLIKQHPESGSLMNESERRILLSRFPYGIIYTIDGNKILVYAIMHLSKKPNYWYSRKE